MRFCIVSLFATLSLGALLLLPSTAPAELVPFIEKFEAVMDGEPRKGADGLVPYLQRLAASCSVEAPIGYATKSRWDDALKVATRVHVRYQEPTSFSTKTGRGEYRIREILLPFPNNSSPPYVLLRNEEQFYALSKYSPTAMADIICSDAFLLRSEPNFSFLCQNWRPSAL